MSINEKITLDSPDRRRRSGWHPEKQAGHHPLKVTRTWSRWRCRQGWKIHRARFAQIYRDEWLGQGRGLRLVVTFWCGQAGHHPIPFREECAEGTEPCGKCEGLFAQHAAATELGLLRHSWEETR